MPTTTCSFCETRMEALPVNKTDTMWDWRCSECGQPVLLDGNAKERQRQRDARNRISEAIQALAADLDTPSYQPYPYSVERLHDRVSDVMDDIEQELERRESG